MVKVRLLTNDGCRFDLGPRRGRCAPIHAEQGRGGQDPTILKQVTACHFQHRKDLSLSREGMHFAPPGLPRRGGLSIEMHGWLWQVKDYQVAGVATFSASTGAQDSHRISVCCRVR